MLILAPALLITSASAYSQLTEQLDLGETNQSVTHLQEFMSSTPAIYPEQLVTGYYGSLTRNAVIRFQRANGLAQVGRVGPQTLIKINDMIGGNANNNTGADMNAPIFTNVTSNKNNNSLTFSFNTSENTYVRVVYSTSPVMFNEGNENSVGFAVIGGNSVSGANGLSNYHTVTVSNLTSNTRYYTTLIATDAAGNVSVYGTNSQYITQ